MIPALATELLKYFFNIDPVLKSKFAVRCKPGYRSPALGGRKESPDSTEQCTPRTSGVLEPMLKSKVEVTDSATENYLNSNPLST